MGAAEYRGMAGRQGAKLQVPCLPPRNTQTQRLVGMPRDGRMRGNKQDPLLCRELSAEFRAQGHKDRSTSTLNL